VPRPLSGDLARLGLAILIGTIVVGGFSAARIWQFGQRDERGQPVDAVVVLGAAQYSGRPSPVFQARIDHGVELVLNGVAPYLVVTGGRGQGDRLSEAEVARSYAIEQGVPPERILSEETGHDTLASLRNARAVLDRLGLRRAVFVSDRTHMLRIQVIARDLGFEAFSSPTRSSPVDRDRFATLDAIGHELLGLWVYLLTGR
jgi:uncharacterized SAM-binding protein YcdF (DUF218 family)